MKLWAKLITDGKIKKNAIFENPAKLTASNFEESLREIAYEFDISTPLCLKSHFRHFKNFNIVKFTAADFVDEFGFDKLEIEAVKK